MVFAGLQHKIRFLTLYPQQQLLQDMAEELEVQLKRHAQHLPTTPATVRILQTDLIYLLLRQLAWVNAPIFSEVVTEFLSHDYKMPRAVSTALIEALTKKIPENLRDALHADAETYNKRFLHFIFVSCATADDEARLVADLGLGTSLLRRIRGAAESVMREQSSPKDKLNFVPELDALLREVMIEIAEEIKITPWSMDEHRLQFMLYDVDTSFWQVSENDLVRKSFQLLLNIGKAAELTFEKILDDCLKLFGPHCQHDATLHLLQILKRKELIFVDMASRGAPKGKWSLAQLGQEITADAFACKYLRVASAKLDVLPQLNAYYQLAIMRRANAQQMPEILEILRDSLYKLSPRALTLAITQLAKHAEHQDIFSLLKPALEQRENPWVRAAICEGIAALARDKSVGHTLANMAQSDDSKRVQESAHSALTRWQAKQHEPIVHA